MYQVNWEQFYQNLESTGQKPLWDVDPVKGAATDLEQLQIHFNDQLPLIDIGCGTGRQTKFLSHYFGQIIGIDVSASAIRIAQETYPDIEFRCVDLLDFEAIASLVLEFGPMNIYCRGVLHQILQGDVDHIQISLLKLMGSEGKCYCIEVSDQIRQELSRSANFNELPVSMKKALLSRLPPSGLSAENLYEYFPINQFDILDSGPSTLQTNVHYRDGSQLNVPAYFTILAPNLC